MPAVKEAAPVLVRMHNRLLWIIYAALPIDKEVYKWELPAKPEGKAAVIILSRKGLDADVQEQATLDTEEGSIIIKNETFRKK